MFYLDVFLWNYNIRISSVMKIIKNTSNVVLKPYNCNGLLILKESRES